MYSKDVINKIADAVRNYLSLSHPYSPEKAIQLLGGTIKYDEDNMAIDACIRKTLNSFEISLNKYTSPIRDNFSLSHELGHLWYGCSSVWW
jgi:Zn-dependent peptidase ImmA (M78 family)